MSLNWQASWLYLLAFGIGIKRYVHLLSRHDCPPVHGTGYLTDTGFALGRYLGLYRKAATRLSSWQACLLQNEPLTYIWLNHLPSA